MNKGYTNINYLRRYIDGKLTHREMYELERAAHQDEMLMDMLMGLEYEKSQNLPTNLDELQQRIQARVKPKVAFLNPWAKWGVAASFFVAVVLASIYLLRIDRVSESTNVYQSTDSLVRKKQQLSVADTTKEAEKSSKIAMVDIHQSDRAAAAPVANEKMDASNEKALKAGQSLEVTAKGADTEEEIVVASPTTLPTLATETAQIAALHSDSLMYASRLRGQQLTHEELSSAVQDFAYPLQDQRSAQLRANVNRTIDPKTSMILNSALDKQEQRVARSADSRIEIQVPEDTFDYLVNVKTNGKKNVNRTPQNLVFSTRGSSRSEDLQWSSPRGGWKALDDYMGRSLREKGVDTGSVQYVFRLDENGVPQDIQIKSSSDARLNNTWREILANGPTWELGADSTKVSLELDF